MCDCLVIFILFSLSLSLSFFLWSPCTCTRALLSVYWKSFIIWFKLRLPYYGRTPTMLFPPTVIVPILSISIVGNSTLVTAWVTLVDAHPLTLVDALFYCCGMHMLFSFQMVFLVFVPWSKNVVGGCGFFSITMNPWLHLLINFLMMFWHLYLFWEEFDCICCSSS